MPATPRRATTTMFCALILLVCVAAPVRAQVVSCPTNGSGGDQISRGLYIQNYTVGSIGTVTRAYITDGTAGSYTVTLTMHDNAYDGPVLGK